MLGPSITKIARPRLSGVFLRDRLFCLLDKGRKKPVIWVGAPAGSGKTTLIASWLDSRKLPCLWYQVDEGDGDLATFFYYMGLAAKTIAPMRKTPLPLLTPEYLQGIPTFTRRYFEKLYGRLRFVLVLDNYQDAPGTAFHEMMANALDVIPDGVRVVVLSRAGVPSQLARLRANNKISLLGWDDIRFTFDESSELMDAHGNGKLTEEAQQRLYENTEGWAAGLVLMLENARKDGFETAPSLNTQREVFDYFASEIFVKSDKVIQDVLLKTAFLPKVDPAVAEKLTGIASTGQILERLSRDHYFTQRHMQAYQYHPLFREFLLHQAQELFTKMEIRDIRRTAAELLNHSNHKEDAAMLFIQAGDWEGLARLIETCAQALIAQGRISTLEGWLRNFPDDYMEGAPWLHYWLGVCRVPFNPVESQALFERSLQLFENRKDATGLFLAWSGVMDSIFLGWGEFAQADRWILMFKKLLLEYQRPSKPELMARITTSMLVALTLRQPYHRDIIEWIEQAQKISYQSEGDIRLKSFLNVYLGLYYLWVGDHVSAELAVGSIRENTSAPDAPPVARIIGRVIEAVYQVRVSEHDLCRNAVKEGLDIATSTGIVIWNTQLYSQGAINALSDGDTSEADMYLRKMGSSVNYSRRVDACMYHYSMAWHALIKRDMPLSFNHADMALQFALQSGSPFHETIARIALAQILHEQGNEQLAASLLEESRRIALKIKSAILDFMILLCKSYYEMLRNDEPAALGILAEAMAIGRNRGYVNFYWWRSDMMSRLCGKALEHGIETEYVRMLIRKRSLAPPYKHSAVVNWPYPIRVYTLDKFEILVDDKPLVFTAKVQQKPLALLKALIALGGKDVAESRLTDILWPDAEGDLARKSFEMTVIRLRRLLGLDNALQLRDRCLSLDDRFCWVDVWALESLLAQVDAACIKTGTSRGAPDEAARLIERAFELYRGDFLPGDDSSAWPLALRERLRSKFSRAIAGLGNSLEQAGHWEKAAEVFRKGLEIDRGAEEFYQHLMVCYQRLGRRAEAVALYNRCRDILRESLGIAPSSRTEAVLRSLMAGD